MPRTPSLKGSMFEGPAAGEVCDSCFYVFGALGGILAGGEWAGMVSAGVSYVRRDFGFDLGFDFYYLYGKGSKHDLRI